MASRSWVLFDINQSECHFKERRVDRSAPTTTSPRHPMVVVMILIVLVMLLCWDVTDFSFPVGSYAWK